MKKGITLTRQAKDIFIPQVFVDIMKGRGVSCQDAIERYLFPSLNDLPFPQEMKNLAQAARKIVDGMVKGTPIILWGDYDVDGTTGTALLVNFFKEFCIDVTWHIPNRLTEGYGLNSHWFYNNKNKLQCLKSFLLVTIDCGSSNREEIDAVKALGGEVIVTDHHSIPAGPLPGCLVINPSQKDCGFHKEHLAGVGVAFYLAAAVRAECLKRSPELNEIASGLNLKQFLAFVALGTLADMVPLTQTNRILVRGGLEALADTRFPGLAALLDACETTGDKLSSEDIGFLIAPKINAAGRLGNSEIIVTLLTERDAQQAKKLSNKLIKLNEERRELSRKNLELALSLVSLSAIYDNKCIVVKGAFHLGVAGIVASRLVDLHGLPAIVFAEKELDSGEVLYTGSARSIDKVDIILALNKCSPYIDKFGGHPMAAGLTVTIDNMTLFVKHFAAEVTRQISDKKPISPKQKPFNCAIETLMSDPYLTCLQLIEPFGPGNEQPVFLDTEARIVDARTVGKEAEHLQVTIRGKMANWKGIGFHFGEKISDIQKTPQRKLAYTPTKNRFRGNVSWQVKIVDI